MEYQEHYDNMEQRNILCDVAHTNGYRMLHDDFDEELVTGEEPHGTLTFTNVPPKQAPEPEPTEYAHPKFNRESGNTSLRLDKIEDFLETL